MNANASNATMKRLTSGLILGSLALTTLVSVGCDERSAGLFADKHAMTSKLIPISSARFKTNVATVSDALSKIERLRGVTFDYKPEFGGPDKLGFIAEEAAQVLPQSVVRDGNGRPYAMDYVAVVPVAVEAIKQLSAENADLKARLANLETALCAITAANGE